MSWYGWRCVHEIDRRYVEGQRAAKVHPWERSRILAGDYSPIRRELKPRFKQGDRFVLTRTRPRGALVEDPLTRVEIVYPKPPAEDLFWVVVREVVRHRTGYWRVKFDVWDRRETELYIRRKPPATPAHDEEEVDRPDDETVTRDSAYTTNPAQAVDHLSAVRAEELNVYVMQAHSRFADHRNRERAEETQKRDLRALTSAVKETAVLMGRQGLDTTELMADLQQQLAKHKDRLRQAA